MNSKEKFENPLFHRVRIPVNPTADSEAKPTAVPL
jgi:hypothetical protein